MAARQPGLPVGYEMAVFRQALFVASAASDRKYYGPFAKGP
jgi:hypothetical protein